mgnify:CR=1 FL=1
MKETSKPGHTTVLPSKLYITEAAESKEKAEKELEIADPDKAEAKRLLEKHIIDDTSS